MSDGFSNSKKSIVPLLCVLLLSVVVIVFWILPDITRPRMPTKRSTTRNSLKQLGIALYNYDEREDKFPPGGFFDRDGRGFHGWQTMLLPEIDQKPLYDSIHFDLLWDAEENRAAFQSNVPLYQGGYEYELRDFQSQSPDFKGYSRTLFSANGRLFFANSTTRINGIADPLSHTIVAGEAAGDYLPWGHPQNWRDPAKGINQGSQTFGSPIRDFCFMLMGDGSVREIEQTIDPNVLQGLSTPDGGEEIKGF